jgi:hypothetical protein
MTSYIVIKGERGLGETAKRSIKTPYPFVAMPQRNKKGVYGLFKYEILAVYLGY